jgi:hypothetical protein
MITASFISILLSLLRDYTASVLSVYAGSIESLITIKTKVENNIVTIIQM